MIIYDFHDSLSYKSFMKGGNIFSDNTKSSKKEKQFELKACSNLGIIY